MRHAWMVLGMSLALATACGKKEAKEKPSHEECKQAQVKRIELMSADWDAERKAGYMEAQLASEGFQRSVEQCLENDSKQTVACVLAATSLEQAKKCK